MNVPEARNDQDDRTRSLWGRQPLELKERRSHRIGQPSESESNLEANLQALVERLKRKVYHARLVRRHYIPKGNGKRRALGIPVLEDKLVQHAAKTILEAIFAYRPGRGAKDAVNELCFRLQFAPVSWVVEADIKGFFDNIDHKWMMRMLEERIDDRAFVRLIGKWLKAGVLEDIHTVTHPGAGTPQGGVISPILANIYLHSTFGSRRWCRRRQKASAS